MISTRQRDNPTAAGRSRLGDALPVIVLGAGLSIVLAIVASSQAITFSQLRDFVGPLYLPSPVGTIFSGFAFPEVGPFRTGLDHRPWPETIAIYILYFGSTMAIGSTVVRAIRGDDEWPAPVRILAGFLPGYLIVLGPLQLLYGVASIATGSWVAIAGLPLAALALHWRSLRAGMRELRLGLPRRDGAAVAVALVVAMALVALVHRLQQGIFYLTQDSILYFLQVSDDFVGRQSDYLTHWQSQTDEWVYNAPLSFADGHLGDLWLPFYATQSVGLAAFLCLLYGVVHRVARRRKASAGALAVVVVFGLTLAIYPWAYVTIVGGGQPVIALAHPGRLIGIVAPWVALMLVFAPRRPPIWVFALATLGLAFTTLNNIMYVGVAIAAALTWRGLRGRGGRFGPAWARLGIHGLPALAVVLPIVAFSYTRGVPSAPIVPALLLVAASAAGLIGAMTIAWGTTKADGLGDVRRALAWSGAWVATACIGLLFSDNLNGGSLGKSAHDLLAPILPGYGATVAQRDELVGGAFGDLSFPAFSQPACDTNESCGGLTYFVLCYGVLLTLVAATWAGYGRLRADAEHTNRRRASLLLSMALLPVALILVFFTGADELRAGTFTRMLEWPCYSLLVLAVLGFCEASNRFVMRTGVAFLAVWTIVPLLSFEWPQQMVRNAAWYVGYLL